MKLRAARRRAARSTLRLGEAYEIQQVLPSDYPTEFDELLTSSRSVGMRMLTFLRSGCGDVVERIQERLNSEVSPDHERRVLRERQGQKSAVTVEMILLAVLVCAQLHKSFRRTDILRTLIGLHEDIARKVGLIDSDGILFVPTYKQFVWQMQRVESVLAEGWTARNGWLTTSASCDLRWFVQALLKASVPRKVRRQMRHVAVDATSVRSWGTWLPKVTKTDIETEPVAVVQRMAVEEDHDDIPDPDLEGLWEAVTESGRLVRFGSDGRPRYSHDPDATIGYKSANSESKAGFFMGYDLHLAVAAPTVTSSVSRLHSADLAEVSEFVVGMSLDPAGTDCGPISARIVLEAREMCAGIGAVSADRGITQRRETFVREMHRNGIDVHMDYKQHIVKGPGAMTLGKNEQSVRVHAGTFLSQQMPRHKLLPPASLLKPGQEKGLAKFYEERAKQWGLSSKKLYPDGRRQLRLPVKAGRVASAPATAASTRGHSVPYVGPLADEQATVTASVEELDWWQPHPWGTRAWAAVYHAARNAVERVNSMLKDKEGLKRGTCQVFGVTANTLSALGLVVCNNLRLAAKWEAAQKKAGTAVSSNGSSPSTGSKTPNVGSGNGQGDALNTPSRASP